jgi:hypothetical protein
MSNSRAIGVVAAASVVMNVALVVGVVLLLVGGSPASTIARHLHLATTSQATTAQATADDAESQSLDAQDQIAEATGSTGSLADAIASMQSTIDDVQAANDDLDGRVAAVESEQGAACTWARRESLQFIGSNLFYAFNNYTIAMC